MDKNNNRTSRQPTRRGSGRITDSYENGGVYYTPSSQGRPPQRAQKPAPRKPEQMKSAARPKATGAPARSPSSKSQYIAFYIVTLIVAVIVCLAVFFYVFSRVAGGKDPSAAAATNTPTQPVESAPVAAVDETSIIGVVRSINTSTKSLEIMDVDNLKSYTFSADSTTTMQNKYGESMSFAEFKPGDIVDARYTEPGGVLSSMTTSNKAWEHKNVTNVKVNSELKTITVGNETYKYDVDRTLSYFNGQTFDIGEIDSLNTVTLKGVGVNAWYVEINKGIGFVDIINGEDIKDGVIEIDNNMTMPLNSKGRTDEPIKVQSGSRRIIVKGSNIEIYTTTIDAQPGETAILDLSQVQITAGVLNLNINESDAIVTINQKTIRASEPQILTYGSYEIIAKKAGFVTYQSTFEMNDPTLELNITLEKEIKLNNITVISTPSGADVYIDNAYIGIAPVTTPVEEGIRTITVKKAGYIDVTVYTDNYHTEYQIGMRQEADAVNAPVGTLPATEQPPVINAP